MAGLVHATPSFGFRPAPVNHSPSPLGFGFGLAASSSHSAWQPHSTQSTSTSFSPSTASLHVKSVQKRRYEDVDDEPRDEEAMDRSPTPERIVRRMIPKRARVFTEQIAHAAQAGQVKNTKDAGQVLSKANDGVDVGMLLGRPFPVLSTLTVLISVNTASLPPQSLLPILTSLLTSHPTLKDNILALIPRPTLETAVQALNIAVKKLRDAYPYSTTQGTLGFGSNPFDTSRTGWGQPAARSAPHPSNSGMRDSYVISRLRPHVLEYVSTAFSYMPYFSFRENAGQSHQARTGKEAVVSHPTETFAYLSALTSHLMTQPPLAQQLLTTELMSRLVDEWSAWIYKVDTYVNKEGGMFGVEVVKAWARALDEFAEAKVQNKNGGMEVGLRTVRDRWVSQVGWLIGRDSSQHSMEDEEEL